LISKDRSAFMSMTAVVGVSKVSDF